MFGLTNNFFFLRHIKTEMFLRIRWAKSRTFASVWVRLQWLLHAVEDGVCWGSASGGHVGSVVPIGNAHRKLNSGEAEKVHVARAESAEGKKKTGRRPGLLFPCLCGRASCWPRPVHCRQSKSRVWNSPSSREPEDASECLPNQCSESVLFGNPSLEIDAQGRHTQPFNLRGASAPFRLSVLIWWLNVAPDCTLPGSPLGGDRGMNAR